MSKAWTLRPDGCSLLIVNTNYWQHTGQTQKKKKQLFQVLTVAVFRGGWGTNGDIAAWYASLKGRFRFHSDSDSQVKE